MSQKREKEVLFSLNLVDSYIRYLFTKYIYVYFDISRRYHQHNCIKMT